jgi:hypothetical protein
VLSGRRPGELCVPGADPLLAGLYDPAPAALDAALARALGVRFSVGELLAEPGGADELLARLADPGRTISRAALRSAWIALAEADPRDVTPPDWVRAVVDGAIEVVRAQDALVLDRPDLLPLLAGQPLVIAPFELADRLAELLDLGRASDELAGVVESEGIERPMPVPLRDLLPGAPPSFVEHDRLVVDGHAVAWWADARSGTPQVSGTPESGAGLARAAAWAAGRWSDRLLAEAVLRSPEALPALLAESELSPP